jgi:acyl-CoA thioesterase YciA
MTYTASAGQEVILKLFPQSTDLNYNGHVAGGWLLDKMDVGGGIVAYKRAGGPIVTAGVADMAFLTPALFGDIINVCVAIERVGRTSMTIRIELVAERMGQREPVAIARGLFTYVAIDGEARPRPVDIET